MKRGLVALTVIVMLVLSAVPVFADEDGNTKNASKNAELDAIISNCNIGSIEKSIESNIEKHKLELKQLQQKKPAGLVGGYYYRKKNVSYTKKWGSYKRVSDNLKTGKKSGKITSTKSKSFSGSVTGNIHGISTIGAGATIRSELGYTLTVPPRSVKYMAYKVKYRYEKGIRVKYSDITRREISRNKYVVKRTLYGQFALLNAK